MTSKAKSDARRDSSHSADAYPIIWDDRQGGTGPRVKNGIFAIERRTIWSSGLSALAILVFSLIGGGPFKAATSAETAARPDDAHILLAQGEGSGTISTSTGTVTTSTTTAPSPPCTHHDSHNDKNIPDLKIGHVDQHGDSCT